MSGEPKSENVGTGQAAAAANGAAPEEFPIPEDVLDDWRWIMRGRDEGWLAPYVGQHIAVLREHIIAHDADLRRVYQALDGMPGLDPDRPAVALID